jgi:hypothetical protein
MSAGLKYALARIGIFVACAVPALVLLPRDMNVFLKLMIAVIISGAIAIPLLKKRWGDEVTEQINARYRRRVEQRSELRAALAGDDQPEDRNPR